MMKVKCRMKTNLIINKDQSLIKWAVLINRFLYSTTVQNFTHLSYSFRVTKPIIGAGRWHGPKTGCYLFFLLKTIL